MLRRKDKDVRRLLGAIVIAILTSGCAAAPTAQRTPPAGISSGTGDLDVQAGKGSTAPADSQLPESDTAGETASLPPRSEPDSVAAASSSQDSVSTTGGLLSSGAPQATSGRHEPEAGTSVDASRSTPTTSIQAPAVGPAPAAAIMALLERIPVKGRAPKTGYDRALFGPAWTDDVAVDGGHNGCDTRNDILRRDLVGLAIKAGTHGCLVLSGVLHDAYTGRTIDFTRGQATSAAVQIDHVVALMDAWQKGAQGLAKQQRENLANDPLNLQAVDGPTNASKGAGDAATWLPPNKSYRCTYVSRQVQVKSKYGLWVTTAEKDAISRVLGSCGATVPRSVAAVPPISATRPAPPTSTQKPAAATPKPAATSTVAKTTTAAAKPPAKPSSGSAGACRPLSSKGNCYQPGQICAKQYRGTSGIDGKGHAITCTQQGDYWRWARS